MKYLASFIVFIILVSQIESNQFNASKFKNFLSNLKPGSSPFDISNKLDDIRKSNDSGFQEVNLHTTESKDNEYKRFRFSSKEVDADTELSLLEFKSFTKLPTIKADWMRINSSFFVNNPELPSVLLSNGEPEKLVLENETQVINTAFVDSEEMRNNRINKQYFYARINANTVYFSPNPTSMATVFFFSIKSVKKVANKNTTDSCFEVVTQQMKSKKEPSFTFCSLDNATTIQWVCLLEKISKNKPYKKCLEKTDLTLPTPKKVVQRILRQPYIVIPTPQRMCNQGWNYQKKAEDWECLCAEGKEQSPIDLPKIEQGVMSPVKPMFSYDIVNESDNKLRIKHDNNTLKITADTAELLKERGFGKLVTVDGTVYYATDVVFHTPSEHTIAGKKFPLEIQVVHEAKSKGDFGKKVVFSVLFEGKPGVYNRFIDDLEFFNLPNPNDKSRMLHNKLFIPSLLLSQDDTFTSVMKPFSFYTYQGSLTAPPCVENVIWYVAAQPVPASITSIDMFKEAMRMPDFEDASGNIILSKETSLENNRPTQPLNGRTVFVYDHTKFSPPMFSSSMVEPVLTRDGHYEKQEQMVTNYVFVEGQEASNMPGSMVVPEEEAK